MCHGVRFFCIPGQLWHAFYRPRLLYIVAGPNVGKRDDPRVVEPCTVIVGTLKTRRVDRIRVTTKPHFRQIKRHSDNRWCGAVIGISVKPREPNVV